MKPEKDFDEDNLKDRAPVGCMFMFAFIVLCTATAFVYFLFFTLSKLLIALS